MKKLLLISALALGMATASAQSLSDYFDISYHGKTVQDGSDLAADEWDAEGGWFHCNIDFAPKTSLSSVSFSVQGLYTGTPTLQQWTDDQQSWGMPSICWLSGTMGNCEPTLMTNTQMFEDFVLEPNKITNNTVQVQFHTLGVEGVPGPDFDFNNPDTWPKPVMPSETSHYIIKVSANDNGKNLGSFSVNVFIGKNAEEAAGVEDVAVDNDAPTVYYDFTGRRVLNPSKGQLVIERKGNKAVKKVIL